MRILTSLLTQIFITVSMTPAISSDSKVEDYYEACLYKSTETQVLSLATQMKSIEIERVFDQSFRACEREEEGLRFVLSKAGEDERSDPVAPKRLQMRHKLETKFIETH